jgi:two-component system cell cycle sensor histidine kinase/response regulator CckA
MTENKIFAKAKQINPWHFIWLSVVFSELFTAFLNSIQSYIWFGKLSPNLLMIGAIDALFIPLIVTPIVIYFIKHTTELQKINERFQQEIMERKRAELELRESESRLRTVMENTPVVLFALDREGVFTLSEGRGLSALGIKPGEVVGRSVFDVYRDAPSVLEGVRRALAGEAFSTVTDVDGIVFEIWYYPVRNERNELMGTTAVATDITERKRIERAVEQAATEWRAAMDASQDVIYLLDLNRRVMRANKSFYTMAGKTPETSVGRHIAEIIHPNGEKVLCPACLAQEEKRDSFIIMEVDNPSNPAGRPIEITVKIVRDKQGQPISILTTLHDLTHERKAQEEKSKLEAQLHQAQKLEAVGQLAGGIAHDFNNMLTAIIGYATLLNFKVEKDSTLRSFATQILSIAEKSADLTRQLLTFSRKQVISPKQIDLNELIRGTEKLLHRVIGEDVELKTRLVDENVSVMVDPGQMEQVLMNLCTNARDAMPNGGLLSISTETKYLDESYAKTYGLEKSGLYVLLTVTDSGVGMDEQTRQKIFEPFFTTKEFGKGTGLGLSIVYGIIKQHNGHITEYSEPGMGTTLKIYLPLVKSKAEEPKAAEVMTPKGGTETILVTEDNKEVRALTKAVLEEFGYKVIEAVDGEDGINKFIENKDTIQLVMLDVVMPKKSGKEASIAIKTIRPDVKILFTSGYTADIIQRKDILEEEADFVTKPVTPHDLLTKIREMLDKKS